MQTFLELSKGLFTSSRFGVFSWCSKIQVEILLVNCRVLVLNGENNILIFLIFGKAILVAHVFLDHGLFVDDNLGFHEHCSQVVKKASTTANLYMRLSTLLKRFFVEVHNLCASSFRLL